MKPGDLFLPSTHRTAWQELLPGPTGCSEPPKQLGWSCLGRAHGGSQQEGRVGPRGPGRETHREGAAQCTWVSEGSRSPSGVPVQVGTRCVLFRAPGSPDPPQMLRVKGRKRVRPEEHQSPPRGLYHTIAPVSGFLLQLQTPTSPPGSPT